MEYTAFNRDAFYHAAWNPLHSVMLHGMHYLQSGCFGPCCMESTAFNRAAWNPLHLIGMHVTTLHGIYCIQSRCMEFTAFNWDPLHHLIKKLTEFKHKTDWLSIILSFEQYYL